MKPLLIEEVKSVLQAELKTLLRKGLITAVTIDSRQVKHGDMFVAVRGERLDGHDFVRDAVQNGATVVLIDRNIPLSDELKQSSPVVLKVDDTIKSLGVLARFYRQKLCRGVILVGVTGSSGKTTVREMIYHTLSKPVLLFVISLLRHPGNCHRTVLLLSHMYQRLHILWKTASAVTNSSKEKRVTYPRITADPNSHLLDIGSELIAKPAQFVHK